VLGRLPASLRRLRPRRRLRDPLPPEDDKELGRAILKELVEINTTHAVGSTVAARAIEQHLLKAGFAADDVVFVAPSDHPTKGNVVVRYRGKGRAKPLLFLGHLDVVEAKPEDWSVDPFKLTEKDGWYYGRGTIDMKDGDSAMLEALIRLQRDPGCAAGREPRIGADSPDCCESNGCGGFHVAACAGRSYHGDGIQR
jgi:arginine utilization protein RocB